MNPRFSILVVCLNPGKRLQDTLCSIENQTCKDYEIIVKDGCSSDGSLSYAEERKKELEAEEGRELPVLKVIQKKDNGIYDAMNQAVKEARGRYVYFLNCGDTFRDENVLRDVADFMERNQEKNGIYYGNIYESLTGQVVASNPHMDAFGCFRNVPCHQACFYEKGLLFAHPFVTGYQVRADYEQFLWCFFEAEAETFFTDILIAEYEGGGFSETKENRKRSAAEHREITAHYMGKGQIFKYRMILLLTLSPLRTRLAQNKRTAGVYNRIKGLLYRRNRSGS